MNNSGFDVMLPAAAIAGVMIAAMVVRSRALSRPAWVNTRAGRWLAGRGPAYLSDKDSPPHFLLVTDLDCTLTMDNHTLTKHATEISSVVDAGTAEFNKRWEAMKARRDKNCVLCYSTGRSMDIFEVLVSEQRARTESVFPDGPLLLPDVLITADGTSIHWLEEDGKLAYDVEWESILKTGWNVEQVRQVFMENPEVAKYGVDLQVINRLEGFRVSAVIEGEEASRIAEESIRRAIDECKSRIDAHVFTCTHTGGGSKEKPQFWLVATSKSGGKGQALDYVRKRISADADNVLVAGDSGNDSPMFDFAARNGVRGVVVGNAKPELFNYAKQFGVHIFAEQYCAQAITYALDKLRF